MKNKMATVLGLMCLAVTSINFLACFSLGKSQASQVTETQVEKFARLWEADIDKILANIDGTLINENIESVYQPQAINTIDEITDEKLSEPGQPYYFKIRAIYKGYDKNAGYVRLQDLGEKQQSTMGAALETAFGIDGSVYSIQAPNGLVSTFPTEANSIATFYLVAVRIDDEEKNSFVTISFVRDIEKPFFDPSQFIIANGMHYITIADAHVQNQEDLMAAYFFGGTVGNSSKSVFDPVVYPRVDLMDARAAMDKKDFRNDYTFPTVREKYVSEVKFRGQTNTTITVSTDDNILTERMSFTGRASSINNGQKIRVYYTIAKDPLEEWEIQAIERL